MKFSISSLYTWYRDLLRNPKYRLWIVVGTLLYLISPFDVSPDVFPILGQIDDGIILTLFLTEVSSMVIESFKARRENTKGENSPANSTSERDTIDVEAVSME